MNAAFSNAQRIVALLTFAAFAALLWSASLHILAMLVLIGVTLLYIFRDYSYTDGFSYRSLLIAPSLLYAIAPIYHIAVEGNYLNLSTGVFTHFLWAVIVYLGLLAIGLPGRDEVRNKISPAMNTKHFATLILLSALLLLAWFVYGDWGTGISRGARLSGQGILATLFEMGFVTCALLTFSVGVYQNRGLLAVFITMPAIYIAAEILHFGDRRLALSLIFGMLIIAVSSGRMKIRIWHALASLFFLPIILVFGVLRAYPVQDWGWLLSSGTAFRGMSLMNTEVGASAIVADTVGRTNGVFDFSPSYHLIPLQMIPQALLERDSWMLPPSLKFVYEYDTATYYLGGGYAYNLLFESFSNFGLLGPSVLALFLILVLRAALNVGGSAKMFLLGSFAFATVFSYRMDLLSWTQTFVYMAIMGVILWHLTQMLVGRAHEPPPERTM